MTAPPFWNFFTTFTAPDGLRLPNVAASIMIAGASEQHPRHDTVSMLNNRSGVVSPFGMPRCFSTAWLSSTAPLTWHAVPWQTRSRCLPTGFSRNCA